MKSGGGGRRASAAEARADLVAAVIIGLFAVFTVVFSLRLDVPGSIYTAPGLFPSIVGATLLAMAAALGWRAIRAGAKIKAPSWLRSLRWVRAFGWRRALRWHRAFRRLRVFCRSVALRWAAATGGAVGQARRTALLMALVTGYVLLVGLINFEFGLPFGFFTIRISSYEVISVIMVAWILRLFWRAHPVRCLIVALVSVEVLASIFRYGFGIPMPAGY